MASKPDEMVDSQHHERETDKPTMDSVDTSPDVVSIEGVDLVLAAKMNLVNDVCRLSMDSQQNFC